MDNANTARDLLRLVGVMAIGVGAAWALQILGLGGSTAVGQMLWVLASAMIAGVGAGLIYASTSLQTTESPVRLRFR